ncbi:MAG: hypothetical protein QW350_04200 [Candidatus Aenigmatarchaeota archaeon]
MGIFDKFKKKEPEDKILQDIPLPNIENKLDKPIIQNSEIPKQSFQSSSTSDTDKLKIDLILSEVNNLKMQMEMINERLKIIERKIDQKGSIRYV